jgi:ribosomal protein S18 acetylase RimI-like enzyme
MNTVDVLPARLSDAAVLAVLIASFRDHLRMGSPSDEEIGFHLPAALVDPGVEFACAWLGAEAVGYTQTRFWNCVWLGGTDAQLEDLFVAQSRRHRGVGRALLRQALARAAARSARRFGLRTNERNEAAQALYRSEGLTPRSPALYQGGREIFWTKELAAAQAAKQPVPGER